METENLWVIIDGKCFNIFSVRFNVSIGRSVIETRWRVFVAIFENIDLAEILKHRYQASSVVVISDSTSIVDMARNE